MTDFTCPECNGTGVYQGLNTVEPCRACGGTKRIGALVDGLTASTEGFSASLQKATEACRQFAVPPIGSPYPQSSQSIGKSVIEHAAERAGIKLTDGPIAFDEIWSVFTATELRQDGFPWPIVTPKTSDFYCHVFDANGLEYQDVVSINLQTGEILQHARDANGSIIIENHEAKTVSAKIPIPIRLEKTGPRYKEKPFDEIMPAELEGITVGRFINVSIEYQDINRLFAVIHKVVDRPLFGFPAKTMHLIGVEVKDGEATGTLVVRPFGEAHLVHLRKIMRPVETHQVYECDPCQDMLFIPILED